MFIIFFTSYRLLRRAIKLKNIDDFDIVMSTWKTFEYTYGTVDQIRDCYEICDKIIENYNRHMASKNVKVHKRKHEPESDLSNVEKKPKFVEESNTSKPKSNQPKTIQSKTNQTKNPFQKESPPKKPQTQQETKPEQQQQEYGDKDDVSVFLSNLAYGVTKEQLEAAFPELNIKDVTLVSEPSGRSKGFGYLELSNPSEVEKALKFDRRPVKGRPVFISKVLRDKSNRAAFKYSENMELHKIFIKGLPFDTTKDELQLLFSQFGAIKDVRLVTKK